MILSIDGNKSIKKSFAQTKFELNLALANNGDSYSQLKIARSYYEGTHILRIGICRADLREATAVASDF